MIQVHDTPKRTRPWDDRFQPAGSLIVMKLETLLFYWKSLLDRLSKTGRVPSIALQGLIRDVEESSGYSRNDARAKAKAWHEPNRYCIRQRTLCLPSPRRVGTPLKEARVFE
jgi:hypothetical protein